MADRAARVGVKYCGGCNPRFDRAALVRRLADACPGAALEPARPGEDCALLLVVCGCTARCADTAGLTGRLGALTVCSEADFGAALASIRKGLVPALSRAGADAAGRSNFS